MREILFRGKRIDNGEWTEAQTFMCAKNVDGSEEAFYLGARNPMIQYDDNFGNIGILETDTSSPIFYKVIPETVGQYTGLTDKNGKKIFEGDIYRYFDDEIQVVEWNDSFSAIALHTYGKVTKKSGRKTVNSFFQGWSYLDDYPLEKMEYLGNVHDNPELLKGSTT